MKIDFAPPGQHRSLMRLAISVVMLALLLGMVWSITSETEAAFPPNASLIPSEEEMHAINSAVDELNFPWSEVLSLVETSVDDNLRIIQLDADARENRLTLHGEARDSRSVLELPDRLRRSPLITDARVISQNPASDQESTGYSIRFALAATFRPAKVEQP
jgi:Fimbrial assembly protein (PilN)